MATLTGQYISQSYEGLIQLSTNTGIVTGSFTQLQDGAGNDLGVSLSGGGILNSGSYIASSIYSGSRPAFPIIETSILFTSNFAKSANFISARNISAASTGSFTVSGSNNLLLLPAGSSNSGIVSSGRIHGVQATNSIILNNGTYISGTNSDKRFPSLSTSIVSNIVVTDNRPTTTATPLTVASSTIQSLTLDLSTGSLSFSNSFISNMSFNVTGSTGTSVPINTSIMNGSSQTVTIDSVPAGSAIASSLLLGSFNIHNISGSLNSKINSSAIIGYRLLVTGSADSVDVFGSTIVGRYNAQDQTANLGNTPFAVGTGTSTAARRTSLHVSSSGLTTISNGLITGSLIGTASFATNATSASYAVTATSSSYAVIATSASYAVSSSFAVSASYAPFTIDTGSFATTGSNIFVGNQTISGSVGL